jgi:tyrosine phenol-lyase
MFLDAKAFLPHLPQIAFPAQALAAEIYIDSGVRTMERGIVSAGRDKPPATTATRNWNWCASPSRAACTPRPTWTWWPSVQRVYERRDRITGLKMTYEPKYLRFFQARFEPLGA